MNNAQDQIDKMINDLDTINDDFVNDYFDGEDLKSNENITTLDDNSNFIENRDSNNSEETSIDNNDSFIELEKPEKKFSYSDILSRLDVKKDIDINNPTDILNLIENSTNSEEFFEAIEKENIDD